MLKYSQYTIKNNTAKNNLYTINKSSLQKDASKIDDITFRGGAHTEQDFRK